MRSAWFFRERRVQYSFEVDRKELMCVFLLAKPIPVPDSWERFNNRQWIGPALLIKTSCKFGVLALITMPVLRLCLAVLGVEVAKTVLMEGDGVSETLHRRIEEACVPVVCHRIRDPAIGVGCHLQ
jgi:hypothetical protein